MLNKKEKSPILRAVEGIEYIKQITDAADIVPPKDLSIQSLALWASIIEDLYESMDGESMGVMIAMIAAIAYHGHSIHEIEHMSADQIDGVFAIRFVFGNQPGSTGTFH
jgi:hypothetical protein